MNSIIVCGRYSIHIQKFMIPEDVHHVLGFSPRLHWIQRSLHQTSCSKI